jgi:tyrosine-specific transport protein
VEVNSTFKERVNIFSMADRYLGPWGRMMSWLLYLFLFYSLLIAYISGSGSLSSTYFQMVHQTPIPRWVGSLFFTLIFGFLAYQGTHIVDRWNRVFMVGKIGTYIAMISLGWNYVNPDLWVRSQPLYAVFSLPVLVIAFGYHNMIPTLMYYMHQDATKVRNVILSGSALALFVYIIWNMVVLGIVPLEGPWGILESLQKGRQASDAVAGVVGLSWMSTFSEALALFALLSSFLAQTLALVHFLADALKRKEEKCETLSLCFLALGPPLILGLIYPDIFIHALNFAGGVCAVILFGILPVFMAWKGRYQENVIGSYRLMGGKRMLITILIVAFFVLVLELAALFHVTPYV